MRPRVLAKEKVAGSTPVSRSTEIGAASSAPRPADPVRGSRVSAYLEASVTPRGGAAAPELEPWQEPVRGSTADVAALDLPGIEQARAMRDGRLPLPSSARLTGRRLVEVGDGWVVFSMPLSPWLAGPKGTLHPGALALLGDSAMTGAIITTLGRGVLLTTAELSMSFMAEMPVPGGELVARASVVSRDGRHGLATAEIRGPGARLLGFGSSRVFLEPPFDTSSLGPLPAPTPEPEQTTPDPWARPIPVAPVRSEFASGDEAGDGPNGLAALAASVEEGGPRPPIDRLLGIRVVQVAVGEVVFAMHASPWLANEFGSVSGGVLAVLAQSATSASGQSAARVGRPFRALDVKVNFLRPVVPDGSEILATGRVLHRGRLSVANSHLHHRGKLVALATGSTVLG